MTTLANNPVQDWQIKRMHVLLRKANLMAYKLDIMNEYMPQGRYVTSSKELTYKEANSIIAYLNSVQQLTPKEAACDRMRKKIISCCRERGWNRGDRADMKQVYKWVLERGYLKKPLNQYTYEELPKLVAQAEIMRNDFLNSLIQ